MPSAAAVAANVVDRHVVVEHCCGCFFRSNTLPNSARKTDYAYTYICTREAASVEHRCRPTPPVGGQWTLSSPKKNRPLCSDDVVHVERLRTTTIALSSIATNASCMCVCVCVWCRDHSTTDTLYSIYRQSVTLAVTQNPEDRRPTTRIGSDRLLWKLFVPIDLKRLPV